MTILLKKVFKNLLKKKWFADYFLSTSPFVNVSVVFKDNVIKDTTKANSIKDNLGIVNNEAKFTEDALPKITVVKKDEKFPYSSIIDNDDLFYYKNMSVFPTSLDFSDIDMLDKMKPNLIDGSYANIEDYLDLQFKLLREDCFRPLINGLRTYMKSPSTEKFNNIRLYRNVRVNEMAILKNRVGYNLDLSSCSDDIEKHRNSRTFMYGSLLLFTRDNFKTILCATVLNTNSWKRKDWQIAVLFESKVPNDIFSHEYLMVESEVYFEPYHRVLRVLQNASTDYLPMQRYIVYATKNVNSPFYIQLNPTYYVKNATGDDIQFEVSKDDWPGAELFGLDTSQMDAFKYALTKEFVVIQGPPGTGKTYLGTTITATLLKNLHFISSPILVICYTNHALDQFMEGLLKYTRNMVRLGKQSKSYALRNCKMKKVKTVASPASVKYGEKEKELLAIYKQIKKLRSSIKECDNSILAHDVIERFSKQPIEFDSVEDDPIVEWLFDNAQYKIDEFRKVKNIKTLYHDVLDDGLRVCFSESIALNAIQTLKTKADRIESLKDGNVKKSQKFDAYQVEIEKIERRLALFKEMLTARDKRVPLPAFDSVYELTTAERWSLYFNVVDEVHNHIKEKQKKVYKKFDENTTQMDHLRDIVHKEKLMNVEVLGMTTTMAARRHNLLKMLKPVIIVVEEAAEVLETHIVASLTDKCKHLVLIGDHQQLRPTSAHYILGRKYNLEVSLFERMVRNGVHSKTLTIQRRMRKEIVDLLVPTIYEKLDSHHMVSTYPDINGMGHNLYFFNHKVHEDTAEEDSSCKNTYEAKWCVSLANYLRRMDYEPDEITILTTYTAQAALLKEMSREYELLQDVLVATVDSFQGKESRIVILSLVRSNEDKNIGFLSMPNRICVALSRAKEGLYIFGNMSCLEIKSKVWKDIKEKLEEQGAIGDKLVLGSETSDTQEVGTVAELDAVFQ